MNEENNFSNQNISDNQNINYNQQNYQNGQENNTKEEPKKNNNLLVVVLLILVLLLSGYIVYDKLIKKEEPKAKESEKPIVEKKDVVEKIDESKSWYYFEDVASYEVINEQTNEKTNVVYKYPVININSADAKKINDSIKQEVKDKKEEFINSKHGKIFGCRETTEDEFYAYINYENAKKPIGYYDVDEFKIKETEKEILLVYQVAKKSTGVVFCGDGENKYIEAVYVVSKETGRELTQREIVTSYGYDYDDLYYKLLKAIYLEGKEETDVSMEDLKKFENDNAEFVKYIKFFKVGDIIEATTDAYTVESKTHYYYENNEFKAFDE